MAAKTRENIDLVMNVCKKGRRTVFQPALVELQSELRIEDLRMSKIPGFIGTLGGLIPGHQIEVDTKARFVRFRHRLATETYKDLWQKIKNLSGTEQVKFRQWNTLPDDLERTVSPTDWATWAFHFRKDVDNGKFKIVSGKCPTYDEIFAMGFPIRLSDTMNTPRREDPKKSVGILYPDEFQQWAERHAPDAAGVTHKPTQQVHQSKSDTVSLF